MAGAISGRLGTRRRAIVYWYRRALELTCFLLFRFGERDLDLTNRRFLKGFRVGRASNIDARSIEPFVWLLRAPLILPNLDAKSSMEVVAARVFLDLMDLRRFFTRARDALFVCRLPLDVCLRVLRLLRRGGEDGEGIYNITVHY